MSATEREALLGYKKGYVEIPGKLLCARFWCDNIHFALLTKTMSNSLSSSRAL
jgi:hypothetical protein